MSGKLTVVHYQMPRRGLTACGRWCGDWLSSRLTAVPDEVTCRACVACHLMPGGGGFR